MSDLMKGIRYFHICGFGDCKRAGYYQSKNGESYCDRCLIKIIDRYGIKEFGPHMMRDIVRIYNNNLFYREKIRIERELNKSWD